MDKSSLSHFYEVLDHDSMSLLYSGDFSDEVTSQVIGLTGVQFDDGSELNKIQKKTGFLIAECFQNIVRHNDSNEENGYFLTRSDGGHLHIASGNVIAKEGVATLSEKLDHLNTLSKDELKDIYVKTLRNQEISEKGGAGLGLIEMARKTKNKLDFEFQDVNDALSYFYFQMKFNALGAEEEAADGDFSLRKSIELRQSMLADHIFLVYQGDISMNTIMPILNMAEKSMQSPNDTDQTGKKFYIVLMEFLQNMSKHGLKKEGLQDGLILLAERDGKYLIGGVNVVGPEDKAILEERLSAYIGLSTDELNEEYKKILKSGDDQNVNGSSLGILEILRRSSAPPEYGFFTREGFEMFNFLIQV